MKTNAAFLARIASDSDFVAARIDTGFIERNVGASATRQTNRTRTVVHAAAHGLLPDRSRGEPWADLTGFRVRPRLAPHYRRRYRRSDFTRSPSISRPRLRTSRLQHSPTARALSFTTAKLGLSDAGRVPHRWRGDASPMGRSSRRCRDGWWRWKSRSVSVSLAGQNLAGAGGDEDGAEAGRAFRRGLSAR